MIKKLFIFILCLVVWFLSTLIIRDYSFYDAINLPSFAPPSSFFPVVWTITYILIAYSMYKIFISYKFKDIPLSYKIALVVNYLFNQSFVLVFFGLKSTLLGFATCIGTFISSLFLYQESLLLKEKSTLVLRLYVLVSAFATILSLAIYFLNL